MCKCLCISVLIINNDDDNNKITSKKNGEIFGIYLSITAANSWSSKLTKSNQKKRDVITHALPNIHRTSVRGLTRRMKFPSLPNSPKLY